MKRVAVPSTLFFVLFAGFMLYPETPCACITGKMVADRIFRIDVSVATADALRDSFSKVVPDFGGEDGPLRLSLVSFGVCDFVRDKQCKLVVKKSLIFEDSIVISLDKDEDGRIIGFNVGRS